MISININIFNIVCTYALKYLFAMILEVTKLWVLNLLNLGIF